jgi:hypothetical protein
MMNDFKYRYNDSEEIGCVVEEINIEDSEVGEDGHADQDSEERKGKVDREAEHVEEGEENVEN